MPVRTDINPTVTNANNPVLFFVFILYEKCYLEKLFHCLCIGRLNL